MTSRLLRMGLRAYPAPSRRADGEMLLACAEEMATGGSSTLREAAGLLRGGAQARVRRLFADLRPDAWRAALGRLALPLAAANLLVWAVGLQRMGWQPMGRWWLVILAAALLCVAGAAARSRWLMGPSAAACLLLGLYAVVSTEMVGNQGGRFSSSLGSLGVDVTAAMLPLLAILVAAGFAVREGDGRWPAWARSVAAVAPVALLMAVDPRGEIELASGPAAIAETLLLCGLLAAVPLSAAVLAVRSRRDASAGPAGALVLVAGLPEIAWLSTGLLPYPGPGVALLVMATLAALSACAVLALGRAGPEEPRGA